jgi:dolichol-phosphate mannosyltransferase
MAKEIREKATIIIPTYNEKENIKELIFEILALPMDYDLTLLIVDDNSPDGTGEIVEEISKDENRVQLLLRKKRRGRGAAAVDAFKIALQSEADYMIEMDADFSHQPHYIPHLLEAAQTYHLVLGSRYIEGGRDADRSLVRQVITFFARNFVRRQLNVRVKDPTTGYRCFRRELLEKIDLEDLISVGPSLIEETLYKTSLMNFPIGEVPIIFVDRKKGKTKLDLVTLLETLIMVMKFKKIYPKSNPPADPQ